MNLIQRSIIQRDLKYVEKDGLRDHGNLLICINLENVLFQNADENCYFEVATTLDEVCKIIEIGFEYVTEMNGVNLFRKRK